MHWAAFTLILGAAAETDGGGEALAARRRLATRPYFVPPPDLTKNWLVHGADHRGARADWNPVCRRYEARTPPLAAAAARLRSQDQSIKRGPAPTLEESRVAGNATRTDDVVALVRTTWARYCRNVVPAYRTWAALLPDAYAVAQEPNRSHAWINELPREMLDYRRDIRPGEQKARAKGRARAALLRLEANALRPARHAEPPRRRRVAVPPRLAQEPVLRRRRAAALRARSALARLEGEVVPLARRRRVRPHRARGRSRRSTRRRRWPSSRRRRGAARAAAPASRPRRSRARRWKPGPAATGRGIDAACTALGSPQKALAAVLASHGVDLLVPPARDVFVVGAAPDEYGELRDERREAADLACATVYPAPCATEAAEAAPRRRLAAREQKRLPIEERRKIAPVAGQKKPPEPYRGPPPPTWRLREGCCAAAAAEAPPAAGTCPARKRPRRGSRPARASARRAIYAPR